MTAIKNKTIVGHVPANISEGKLKFASLRITSLSCIVTGSKINRGASYQLEVAVKCFEHRHMVKLLQPT